MGSTTVPLWATLLLTLIPSLVAIAALIAAEVRDRRRLQHERDMRDLDLEAQRDARLRDERIAAYRKLLAATTTAYAEREGVSALEEAYAEISLLADTDEIVLAAAKVWIAYGRTQRATAEMQKNPQEGLTPEFREAYQEARKATDEFLVLAHKELQVTGRAAEFQALEGAATPGKPLPGPETGTSEP